MNEKVALAKIIFGIAALGSAPAVLFGSWSKSDPQLAVRFLAIATAMVYIGPTLTFAYYWAEGWVPRDHGPLSEKGYGVFLGFDVAIAWILIAATLSTGITFAARHRQPRILAYYLSLFGLQVGWAVLDSAFFIALTN
jgi:hypothetical protein